MIRRALLSVSDKTGIVELARSLRAHGVVVMSTGGTLEALRAAGVEAIGVDGYTGSPEAMGGRVKTLHPRVHGGILAREGTDDADLATLGGDFIDLVVVNLYPFERTVESGADDANSIENIDIGGPAMLRSAAKNHARVTVICDPADHEDVIRTLPEGPDAAHRRRLAGKAFAHTAAYDAAIASYVATPLDEREGAFPPSLTLSLERVATLRYGENPHQRGAWYRERGAGEGSLSLAESLGAGGRELSFNNLVDLDAALELVREFEAPAAAVIKHTNPCGVATHARLEEAFRLAREADSVSAFGGIVALNRPCDRKTADVLIETFLECIVAPAFDEDALAVLRQKKNLRLVCVGAHPASRGREVRRIGGGFVVQDADPRAAGEVARARVVTRRAPTADEYAALEVAWLTCKHVKSNAIVLARGAGEGHVVIGVGAGQMSRVESVRMACDKAAHRAVGSVLASDAFFPFDDGVRLAAERGISALAQPGGSVKDEAVIAAADAAGVAMVFTGIRHFRH